MFGAPPIKLRRVSAILLAFTVAIRLVAGVTTGGFYMLLVTLSYPIP